MGGPAMTADQDNGARALAERLGNALGLEGIAVENVASMGIADRWVPDDAMARRLAAAILANGAAFLPDAAELDRLRVALRDAGQYIASLGGDESAIVAAQIATAHGSGPPAKGPYDPDRIRERVARAAEGSARDGG